MAPVEPFRGARFVPRAQESNVLHQELILILLISTGQYYLISYDSDPSILAHSAADGLMPLPLSSSMAGITQVKAVSTAIARL